jgi:hypothetical protein
MPSFPLVKGPGSHGGSRSAALLIVVLRRKQTVPGPVDWKHDIDPSFHGLKNR